MKILGKLFGNRSAFELFLFSIGSDELRIKLSRKWGVGVGTNCRIFHCKYGSEPYLISIGNHCEITAGVTFITHDGGTWIFRESHQFQGTKYGSIVILDNSFIGANSILLPGVRIGPNSIVGAGSVITRDVPPDSVYAGNPARFICDTGTYLERCRRKNSGIIGSQNKEEKLIEKFFG